MGFDAWGPTRRPSPPKAPTDTSIISDLDRRQRELERSMAPKTVALGKIGSYERKGPYTVAWNTPLEITFTTGRASQHTSFRPWCNSGVPANAELYVDLSGDGSGADTGKTTSTVVDDALKGLDADRVIGGVTAKGTFAWTSPDLGPDPDPLEFYVDIISSPL